MTFDPPEGDVAALEHVVDERLPQVTVGDRLALTVLPAALAPPDVPLVAKAVHDVRRVADHVERAVERPDGFEHGGDLHPLGGGVCLRPAGKRTLGNRPCPPPP